MCLIITAPLDNTASKPMPFQDRVSYSVKSAASAPIQSQPAPRSAPKPVTLSCKRGQPEKRPTSRGRSRIKPEENQPKVSQFFEPLVVLVDSSGVDFLPDLVDTKKKYVSGVRTCLSPPITLPVIATSLDVVHMPCHPLQGISPH